MKSNVVKFKKPTSLFKCWLRNRNFTQNTLDTRCQIKSPMWPHKIWQFRGGGVNRTDDLPLKSPSTIYPKSSVRFTPPPPKSPGKICPSNRQGRFTPPQIIQFWAKFQTHTTSCFASQRSFLRKTNNHNRTLVALNNQISLFHVFFHTSEGNTSSGWRLWEENDIAVQPSCTKVRVTTPKISSSDWY